MNADQRDLLAALFYTRYVPISYWPYALAASVNANDIRTKT